MNQILATDVYIESWLQFLYKQCFFYFTVIISFSRHEDAVKMFKAVSILIYEKEKSLISSVKKINCNNADALITS